MKEKYKRIKPCKDEKQIRQDWISNCHCQEFFPDTPKNLTLLFAYIFKLHFDRVAMHYLNRDKPLFWRAKKINVRHGFVTKIYDKTCILCLRHGISKIKAVSCQTGEIQ